MGQDSFQKPYSDETATLIDNEVRKLVESQYIRAKELLTEHREELEKLAQQLLEKEVLLKSDVERLIGLRPFNKKPDAKDLQEELAAKGETPPAEEQPEAPEEV
jgi:cell division protease FtsH